MSRCLWKLGLNKTLPFKLLGTSQGTGMLKCKYSLPPCWFYWYLCHLVSLHNLFSLLCSSYQEQRCGFRQWKVSSASLYNHSLHSIFPVVITQQFNFPRVTSHALRLFTIFSIIWDNASVVHQKVSAEDDNTQSLRPFLFEVSQNTQSNDLLLLPTE